MSDLIEPMAESFEALEQIDSNGNGSSASHMNEPHPSEAADRATTEERDDAHPVDADVKAVLEALLFVSGEPLSVERCTAILGQVTKSQVQASLRELQQDYQQEGRALQVVQVAGGYRLATKEQFAPWIRRLDKAKAPAKLSRSAVESLAEAGATSEPKRPARPSIAAETDFFIALAFAGLTLPACKIQA